MKLSDSFFTSAGLPASEFSQVSGKYIKLTSGSNLASFAQLCNPSTLSTAFSKEDTGFVKAGTATVNGQPTLAFKQPKNPPTAPSTFRSRPPRRSFASPGPPDRGSVDFSDYNASATITAPPASQVIDGTKFGLWPVVPITVSYHFARMVVCARFRRNIQRMSPEPPVFPVI